MDIFLSYNLGLKLVKTCLFNVTEEELIKLSLLFKYNNSKTISNEGDENQITQNNYNDEEELAYKKKNSHMIISNNSLTKILSLIDIVTNKSEKDEEDED